MTLNGMMPALDRNNPNDKAFEMARLFFHDVHYFFRCDVVFSHIFCTRSSPPPSSLFVQVVVYGMALSQALNLFNATVSKQALHQRIARWRNNLKPPFDATMQEIEALRRGAVPETASSLAGEEIVVTPSR